MFVAHIGTGIYACRTPIQNWRLGRVMYSKMQWPLDFLPFSKSFCCWQKGQGTFDRVFHIHILGFEHELLRKHIFYCTCCHMLLHDMLKQNSQQSTHPPNSWRCASTKENTSVGHTGQRQNAHEGAQICTENQHGKIRFKIN